MTKQIGSAFCLAAIIMLRLVRRKRSKRLPPRWRFTQSGLPTSTKWLRHYLGWKNHERSHLETTTGHISSRARVVSGKSLAAGRSYERAPQGSEFSLAHS